MGRSAREPAATSGTCPICGAPTDAAYRPFCSRRCADVDLSRWLRGAYAIPGGQPEADEDGDDAQAARRTEEHKRGDGHEDE